MRVVMRENKERARVPFLLDVPEDVFPDLFTVYVKDREERGIGFLPPHLFIEKYRIRIY